MPKTKVVFSAFITLKNGKRIYARHYGKEAFRFEIEEKTELEEKKADKE